MQLTFLNFIVIKTSAFDNINLLSNSNVIDLHPSKLKPRANRRKLLWVVVFVCTWLKVWSVSNFAQQLPTTCNNKQQGVQTDTTCNICCEVFWKSFLRFFSCFKFIFCFIKWVKVSLDFFHVGVFLFCSFSTARGFTWSHFRNVVRCYW